MSPSRPLTPQMVQLIELLRAGRRPCELAEPLGVSPATVGRVLRRARNRLGCASNAEIVKKYVEEMGK